jgi:hypothetical protein
MRTEKSPRIIAKCRALSAHGATISMLRRKQQHCDFTSTDKTDQNIFSSDARNCSGVVVDILKYDKINEVEFD